jgi:colicin import membrane protein
LCSISFAEFLGMVKAPESGEKASAMGEITRQPKNKFFEEAAAALKDNPEAHAAVKKEYEERKRKAQLKAEVEAREKAEKEAEEKARQESKNKLADRMKAFDGAK